MRFLWIRTTEQWTTPKQHEASGDLQRGFQLWLGAVRRNRVSLTPVLGVWRGVRACFGEVRLELTVPPPSTLLPAEVTANLGQDSFAPPNDFG